MRLGKERKKWNEQLIKMSRQRIFSCATGIKLKLYIKYMVSIMPGENYFVIFVL